MALKTIFRYPGGKIKIVKHIMPHIQNVVDSLLKPMTFVDVFVGGGSVFIGVMNQFPSAKIVINDVDRYMHSFWSICSKNEIEELIGYISKYKNPTIEDFSQLRSEVGEDGLSVAKEAFFALFFNRTAFSGIFSSGPMGGFEQDGKYKIGCRYNAPKMMQRIKELSERMSSDKVVCLKKDFLKVIEMYGDDNNAVLYLDPPYMKQGKQLYNHFMQPEQYSLMANALKDCKANWIVSHDDHPDFVKLFEGWTDIQTIDGVPYTINSIKGKKRKELIIRKKVLNEISN